MHFRKSGDLKLQKVAMKRESAWGCRSAQSCVSHVICEKRDGGSKGGGKGTHLFMN